MKIICQLSLIIEFVISISQIKANHFIKKCDYSKMSLLNLTNNAPYRNSENYIDYNTFISQLKKSNVFQSIKELNNLFTLIDNNHRGYILYDEYAQFESTNLIPFINCDKNQVCKLTQSQYEKCLNCTSLHKEKEINFYNYVIISNAIFTFKQYQDKKERLNNVTFTKALNTFFNRKITINESLLVYYTGINLFKRGSNTIDNSFSLSEYVSLVRSTNTFLDLSSDDISNGFIILNNYIRDIQWAKYLLTNEDTVKYSYEDFLYVNFYYEMFTKYSNGNEFLNKNNLYSIFNDVYFPNDYRTYLSMLNNTNNNTTRTFSFKSVSLFDNLEKEIAKSNIEPLISSIYAKLALTDKDRIYFNEFVSMMKYFDLYARLYKIHFKKIKKLKVISSNEIGNIISNDIHHMLSPHPPLSKRELFSLSKIELLNSPSVDIVTFISYITSNNK